MTPKKILNANELSTILHRLCFQLIEDHNDFSETVLVGIQPRGVQLANRLLKLLADNDKNNKIDLGLLDITFFRDDFRRNEKSLKASATKLDFSILNNSTLEESDSLLLSVLRTDLDGMFVYDDHCGRGVFLETHVLQLEEISPFLNREIQTLTYCGVEKSIMLDWLKNGVNGIDRIVPVGQALNFDYIWDGLDLFASLSRIVTYK